MDYDTHEEERMKKDYDDKHAIGDRELTLNRYENSSSSCKNMRL